MANVKVLLTQSIDNLGHEGDKVQVRAGFARNFLFPRNMALMVNRANERLITALMKKREAREAKELEEAQVVAQKLEKFSLAFALKTANAGKKVFGSVRAIDLRKRLEEEGIQLDRKKIKLPHPVKDLGKHTAEIKLHKDMAVELSFEVVSENPIEEPVAADSEQE